ncbi:MAG TPA: metallopeptidase TldD-related protein [Bryobacteraceae bacterium]|nr:metallopeptidase TldD-related protein [Bryobacteraceae bacterium]
MRRTGRFVLCACAAALALQAQGDDMVLKAMRDELAHAAGLANVNLEKPYFFSYEIEDAHAFVVQASLGGLIGVTETRFRVPYIQVRVGDYKFDDTNYVGSGLSFGSRYSLGQFPIEDSYPVLRRYLWLETDQAYKAAVESIARKRAALKNMAEAEPLADFAHAEPVKSVEAVPHATLDRAVWTEGARSLSAIFAEFPQVLGSDVEVQELTNLRRLVNSEGTEVRTSDEVFIVRVRATGQAGDGMRLRDSEVIEEAAFDRLPAKPELEKQTRRVAENIAALSKAPVGETYNGPVLFEGEAAAQLFAELLGKNLALTRRPVNEPGRPGMFAASELEGRQGSRVLPEWMDAVDDPTQTEWHGRRLFGSYRVDYEGVQAKPLTVVEKGELKNFFLTRQPVTGFAGSNGRARLPGAFGAWAPAASNLFVRAGQTSSLADLKKKMLEICRARNQKYGILVRKLDFPSSASVEEVRRMMAANAADGSGSHLVSQPTLIYRLYPDGREELIRGMRFRDLNVRSLRDIRAAADDNYVLDYLENGAPLALMGAGRFIAETSVIAPSVLVDDVAVRKVDEEMPKLPVVPAPALSTK